MFYARSLRNIKFPRWARIGILGATVVVYPFATLICDGPLLDLSFRWRRSEHENSERVNRIIEEQYRLWLEKESRLPEDAPVKFSCASTSESMDTYARGSLGVRSGARISLPFYSRFNNYREAFDYCKQYVEPMTVLGKPVCVLWESEIGREIAETFVLSEKALRFLILRDLYANDGYSAYSTKAVSFATFSAFSSFFTYWFHQRFFGGKFFHFFAVYAVFLLLAWYGSQQWYYLYRYMADIHADSMSSHTSFEHSEGGREYYWKMLKRNRLLRTLMDDGMSLFSAAGDVRKAITPLMTRYELLKDTVDEDKEIKETVIGDD